jgi:hypothetical protein
MKTKLLILAGLAVMGSAQATVTLNTVFGPLTTSSLGVIPDGTLWALVVSTDAGNTFAGNFGLGGAIISDADAQASFTPGQLLTLGGLIGGDTIIAMGGFTGASQGNAGYTQDALELTLASPAALTAGKNTAFYYFPGSTFGVTNSVGGQVGGFNATTIVGGDFDGYGMVIPADGSTVGFGGLGTDAGGTVATTQAFNLVPEPSAALLGAIGALGLLRRRRN